MLRLFPAYLRGEDLFGLTVSAVARIAESVSAARGGPAPGWPLRRVLRPARVVSQLTGAAQRGFVSPRPGGPRSTGLSSPASGLARTRPCRGGLRLPSGHGAAHVSPRRPSRFTSVCANESALRSGKPHDSKHPPCPPIIKTPWWAFLGEAENPKATERQALLLPWAEGRTVRCVCRVR